MFPNLPRDASDVCFIFKLDRFVAGPYVTISIRERLLVVGLRDNVHNAVGPNLSTSRNGAKRSNIMVSDARVDRYYYIFDSRTCRPLVLDRATGAHGSPAADRRAPLIDHVSAQQRPTVLRTFARWCAKEVGADAAPSHSPAGRLWAAAQRDVPEAWRRVRRETADTVMLAVSLGLSRHEPEAARLLTLQACTHPEAMQAAHDAAHMCERWAEFSAETDPTAAALTMRARHVNWLLDQMSKA